MLDRHQSNGFQRPMIKTPPISFHPAAIYPDSGQPSAAGPSSAAMDYGRRTAMTGNGQMIIELDRKRMVAMAEKDVATLNALLADDLVYTHSSARLDTKQSLIGAMQSGATVYS